MKNGLFLLGLLILPASLLAQATAPIPRTTVVLDAGRGIYTNYGWPGTLLGLGVERRLSARSFFSVQPRLSGFRADSKAMEPDKSPGEQYRLGIVEVLGAVRTSRRPERLGLRFELGGALLAGRETHLSRYAGTYLNPDGTLSVLRTDEYTTERFTKPGLSWGLGADATLQGRLYLGVGIESRTYSLFPGDLLSANLRLGYAL